MSTGRNRFLDAVAETASKFDTERLFLLSLYVFVLVPALTTLVLSIDFRALERILLRTDIIEEVKDVIYSDVWDGFGADNDDDGFNLYQTLFSNQPSSDSTGTTITQISFIVLIGQIINSTNKKIIEYSRSLSLLGIGIYLALLFLILGTEREMLSILVLQFATLASYTIIVPLTLGWAKLRQFLIGSKKQGDRESLDKKRPRIRNSRN